MATAIQTQAPKSDLSPLYKAHDFCGKTVTVEFLKTSDQEPRDIFVRVNDYEAVIRRGSPVVLPQEVFDVLQRATYTDQEEDPEDPRRKVSVEKQRYAYNVLSRQ